MMVMNSFYEDSDLGDDGWVDFYDDYEDNDAAADENGDKECSKKDRKNEGHSKFSYVPNSPVFLDHLLRCLGR